jgi:hypothetical protein
MQRSSVGRVLRSSQLAAKFKPTFELNNNGYEIDNCMNELYNNKKYETKRTATGHQTFKYNKTFSFYQQYVFDRIIFILPGQLTGAAVDVEVVNIEVVVVVVVVELCMWTPWTRTARKMETNIHSIVGGRTGSQ